METPSGLRRGVLKMSLWPAPVFFWCLGLVVQALLSPVVLSLCWWHWNELACCTAQATLQSAHGVEGCPEALWKSHLNSPHRGETEQGDFSVEGDLMIFCWWTRGLGKDELQASKCGPCARVLFLRGKASKLGVAWVCAAPARNVVLGAGWLGSWARKWSSVQSSARANCLQLPVGREMGRCLQGLWNCLWLIIFLLAKKNLE